MPKNSDDLEKSRLVRASLIAKWGTIPSSIFTVDWSKSDNLDLSDRSYQKHKEQVAEKYGKEFSLSSTGARFGDLSKFPQDLGTFLVNFYCKENGLVVDPFSGHNSRAELVWRSGRDYIGFDISHTFIQQNNRVKEKLYAENPIIKNTHTIEFIEYDSRYMLDKVSENIADFTLTSPPFYDIEDYGQEKQQLSNCKTYLDFLHAIEDVFSNCYKIIKDNCFIAIECNDFRKNGKLHLYHCDTIRALEKVGFVIHDIIIVNYGTGFLSAFALEMERLKMVSKNHSYVIVGVKEKKKAENIDSIKNKILKNNQENKTAVNSRTTQTSIF